MPGDILLFTDPTQIDTSTDVSYTLRGLERKSAVLEQKTAVEEAIEQGLAMDKWRRFQEELTKMGEIAKEGLGSGVKTLLEMPKLLSPKGELKPISDEISAYYREKPNKFWSRIMNPETNLWEARIVYNYRRYEGLTEELRLKFDREKGDSVYQADLMIRLPYLENSDMDLSYNFDQYSPFVTHSWDASSFGYIGYIRTIEQLHNLPPGYQTGPGTFREHNAHAKLSLYPASPDLSNPLGVLETGSHDIGRLDVGKLKIGFRRKGVELATNITGHDSNIRFPISTMPMSEFTTLYAGTLAMLPIKAIQSPK